MTENTPEKPKTVAASKKPAAAKPAATKPAAAKKPATPAKPTTAAPAKPTTAAPAASAPAAASAANTPPAPAAALVPAPTAYVPPPPAPATPTPMLESEARMWAMLLHVLAAVALVVSAGTLAFIVPLVIWLVFRDRSALIDHHGKQNLNLQLTSILIIIVGTVIGLITIGFGFLITGPLMIAYGIYALIISIVAGMKANGGEYYTIPVVIRFIR